MEDIKLKIFGSPDWTIFPSTILREWDFSVFRKFFFETSGTSVKICLKVTGTFVKTCVKFRQSQII